MGVAQTSERTYSAEELACFPKDSRYELVKGRLREMAPTGGTHGFSTSRMGGRIDVFVEDNDLGLCFAAETGFLVAQNPDTVLAPDFAFIAKERLPGPLTEKYVPIVPDLVVETDSPSDSRPKAAEKVRDWLAAGVRMALELKPKTKQLIVHRPGRPDTVLEATDMFFGEDVLPGFSRPVSGLFA